MNENKHFIPDSVPDKPPKRLFWVVIKRLKLEKNLKIFKEKFSGRLGYNANNYRFNSK